MEIIIALAIALFSVQNNNNNTSQQLEEKEIIYNPSETRLNDIIHTQLDLSFDWKKQHVHGEALIEVKPYFYPTSTLVLDAKGFDIHLVEMNGEKLKYTYDDFYLTIELGREYNRNETYKIKINYLAKPNELNFKGGRAISQAKGLYFINPYNTEDKPQQIWTQGETEASSCWFPTIDSPNERMTQDINVTVQNRFKTLSNGLLINSIDNKDGTRTDYWSQKLAHVPYLAMLAIGEFLVTTDTWKDIDVEYFLEEEYHPYARQIFGRTPEMMQFFSDILGVEYPWEKYAQVVVRDFVSGAMENTTAVIHGEFVQMNKRELLDDHEEDIIAHELIHHWFGDLVTCESWANLPLNESFATYGEYMWRLEGFGRMAADQHLDYDLISYMNESRRKQVDMIRFDYSDKEDMFDNHSYAKGGRILHMLRNILGDDAFYNGLKKYLVQNAFSTVEIHQLRLAMEEVCGQDLNWFFNQWFLASGHPILVIDYFFENNKQIVQIEQIQDNSKTPVYKLPMSIDVYVDGKPKRYEVVMNQKKQRFTFDVEGLVSNVIVDAEHMLLAQIFDEKPDSWWLNQQKAPLYMDQKLTLQNISQKNLDKAIISALKHDFWGVRILALNKAIEIKTLNTTIINMIEVLAKNDDKTKVVAKAIEYLSSLPSMEKYSAFFEQKTQHLSYAISGSALLAYSKIDPSKAVKLAEKLEEDAKSALKTNIKMVYAEHGEADKMKFFVNCLETEGNYDLYRTSRTFVDFLKNQDLKVAIIGLDALEKLHQNATSWMVWVSKQLLEEMKEHFKSEVKKQKTKEFKDLASENIQRIDLILN